MTVCNYLHHSSIHITPLYSILCAFFVLGLDIVLRGRVTMEAKRPLMKYLPNIYLPLD